MTDDNRDNLVPEHLRAMRAELSEMNTRLGELGATQGALMETQSGMFKLLASQDAWLARLERDVSLIKRRLDIADAPAE